MESEKVVLEWQCWEAGIGVKRERINANRGNASSATALGGGERGNRFSPYNYRVTF